MSSFDLSILQKHVLLLLYAKEIKPIPSISHLQKEFYLVAINIDAVGNEASYVSGANGPYSIKVNEALKALVEKGFVLTGDMISLLPDGIKIAEKLSREVPKDTLELIDDFKEDLNDMNEKELSTFIYLTFQESDPSLAPDWVKEGRFAVAEALYRREKISVGRAAEIAGIPLEAFRRHVLRSK